MSMTNDTLSRVYDKDDCVLYPGLLVASFRAHAVYSFHHTGVPVVKMDGSR